MRSHSRPKRQAGDRSARGSLPDRIRPGLDILFVGINPGLRSARIGHHYAGPGNRFWPLLNRSGLLPDGLRLEPHQDGRLPDLGLGLTNLVARPTPGSGSLRSREMAGGARRLRALVRRHRPRIVALVGVTVYRGLFPDCRGTVRLGPAPRTLAGRPVFVLPNPSGRNAGVTTTGMLRAFRSLARARQAGAGSWPAGAALRAADAGSRLTEARRRRTIPRS